MVVATAALGAGAENHIGEAYGAGELIPRSAGKYEAGEIADSLAKVMGVKESVVEGTYPLTRFAFSVPAKVAAPVIVSAPYWLLTGGPPSWRARVALLPIDKLATEMVSPA